jgi:hypothetical protein
MGALLIGLVQQVHYALHLQNVLINLLSPECVLNGMVSILKVILLHLYMR